MNWIPQIFRRRKLYNELSEEIRMHIEERTEQLVREGMSATEAEQAARRAFGNRTLLEERSREVWQWPTLESIGADVLFALRQFRRSPGFAFAAIVTLALAIGANAVVFAVLNGFFLRPLNVPQGQSLYAIQRGNATYIIQSYPDYLDLRDRNRSFDGLAAYTISQAGIVTGKDPSHAWLYQVSGNYFDVLGIHPYMGRLIHSSDEHGPNSAPYIVLSYKYWHSHFQDDRSVVGRSVLLNKHPFAILGQFPTSETYLVVRSGRAPQQLVAAVRGALRDLDPGLPAFIQTWNEEMNGALFASRTATASLGVLGAMGAMLSITGIFGMAAFSVGKRLRELGIRIALGAQRKEVLHAALGRAFKLLAIGSAAGLVLGLLATRVLAYIVYQATPRDPLVLAGAVVAMALLGLVATWIPAQRALSVNPLILLRED